MKISFCCQSCDARLKADAAFAGRKIRCPHCGQTTQIPKVEPSDVAPDNKPSASTSPSENSNDVSPLSEICAFFEPNPFAFSFALETEISADSRARSSNVVAERSNSGEFQKLDDAVVSNAPQTFYREEFMRNRKGNVDSDSSPERSASKSPSVNEMIAGLLEENEQQR